MTATHYFATDATLAALAGRAAGAPLAIVDRGGDEVSLAADEALAIEVVKPDEVQIGLPNGALPDRGRGARRDHQPRRRGDRGAGPGARPPAPSSAGASSLLASAPEPPARWTFVVRFPAARRQAALDELGDIDRTVEIRDARETIATRVSELAVGRAARWSFARPARPNAAWPPRDIAAVHTIAPVVIPDGAYLLIEGDRPRDHVASVIISLVLMTFGVFNVVALVRNR